MKLAVSFLMTHANKMRKHWAQNSPLAEKGVTGTETPIGRHVELGGILVVLDWGAKKMTKAVSLSCPSGLEIDNENLYVASMRENEIYVLNPDLEKKATLTHDWFNDIHSLNRTGSGLLVTSSGLDLIMEIDFNGRVLWEWWATEQGYLFDQRGRLRNIDKHVDHRKCDYPTLAQTTHVNSAVPMNGTNAVLATLFHQGEVVQIDVMTKKATRLITGLQNPHAVYALADGTILVSNTKGANIQRFTQSGELISQWEGNYDWIQDTCPVSNGTYFVADANNHRIVQLDAEGKKIDMMSYDDEWKIYQIKELPNGSY